MDRNVGVTETIRRLIPEWTVPIFETAALAGDLMVVIAVLAVVCGLDGYRFWRGNTDAPLTDRTIVLLGVVLGGLALTLALKTVFDLPRPPIELQAVPRDGSGFPSGHTLAATVLWGAITVWGRWGTVRQRAGVTTVLVAAVALSRLGLGVHYLGDVLASIGFGIAYLLVAAVVYRHDPMRAVLGATILGVVALLVTGGSTDGWVAFIGCAGGALGWYVLDRPSVRRTWTTTE